jgi:pimeloyl-ACP methyl ester carboxylesterase
VYRAGARRSLAVLLLLAAAAFGWAAWYDRSAPAPGAWLSAAGLEPRFETVGGRRLRFVRAGSGPAIVLVHGFGSSIYTWKDVIAPFAARHGVVALDLPGFGESDRPADLSIDDLPRAVTGLMDRLGLERATLVGNSMGGATAALVAATSPERVDALVLIDAAGFNLEPEAQPASVRLATSWAAPALELLPGKRLVVEHSLRQVFHDDRLVTEERVAEYLAPALRPGTFAGLRSLGASLDAQPDVVTRALPGVRAPTLVIWGDDDRWIPPAHADRFAAAIPGARAVRVASCGHVPEEEQPAEVARLVLELLAEASARAAP